MRTGSDQNGVSLDKYGAAMDEDEIAAYLETRGVGTLSFGSAAGGYGIPMSFGYDRDGDRCILQFAFDEGSLKREFLDSDTPVTLSTFDWESIDDWRSVVCRGTLHPVPEDQSVRAAGVFAAHAKIASLEVFRSPMAELDLEWYELRISERTGRKATR